MLDCLVNWPTQLGFDDWITVGDDWEKPFGPIKWLSWSRPGPQDPWGGLMLGLHNHAERMLSCRNPPGEGSLGNIHTSSWWPIINQHKGWWRIRQGRLLSWGWWTQVDQVPTLPYSLRPADPRTKYCPVKNIWYISPSTCPHLTKPGHIFVPT